MRRAEMKHGAIRSAAAARRFSDVSDVQKRSAT
jgi:hypothetical protein